MGARVQQLKCWTNEQRSLPAHWTPFGLSVLHITAISSDTLYCHSAMPQSVMVFLNTVLAFCIWSWVLLLPKSFWVPHLNTEFVAKTKKSLKKRRKRSGFPRLLKAFLLFTSFHYSFFFCWSWECCKFFIMNCNICIYILLLWQMLRST